MTPSNNPITSAHQSTSSEGATTSPRCRIASMALPRLPLLSWARACRLWLRCTAYLMRRRCRLHRIIIYSISVVLILISAQPNIRRINCKVYPDGAELHKTVSILYHHILYTLSSFINHIIVYKYLFPKDEAEGSAH